METLIASGVILLLMTALGFLLMLAGHIWLMVQAFGEGPGWGLAILFLPGLADVLYSIDHWAVAKKPFLIWLAGALLGAAAVGAPFLFSGLKSESAVQWMEVKAEEGMPELALVEEARESGLPVTDRDRVAGLLETAGIDPQNPRTFVGRTISAMTEVLGPPSATLKMGREHTFIYYHCFEVTSKDGGKTVASVHYMAREK